MKKLLLITGLFIPGILLAQSKKEVSLDECQQKAIENYPLSDQFELLESSKTLKLQNLNKNYLPNVDLSGQATYQSDVTKVPIEVPMFEIPEISKDQYKLSLDINQVIYDGGITSNQKSLVELNSNIENQKVKISLYKLKENITNIYFNIIYLRKNLEVLKLLENDIQSKIKDLAAGVRYGVILEKDLNVLKAELLKIEQNTEEIESSLMSAITSLSEFTGEQYNENTKFLLPQKAVKYAPGPDLRLDYQLMNIQQTYLKSSKNLISSKSMPKFFAFGQAGYGRPGLDMLSNDFETFYIVGAKLSWNIWNWNRAKNEKTIIDLQNNLIENQKAAFEKNLSAELKSKFNEIEKFKKLISKDEEIIQLREAIKKTASAQLDNGVITSTEYITELHNETEARLNMELHKVQLLKAKYNYLSAKGDL